MKGNWFLVLKVSGIVAVAVPEGLLPEVSGFVLMVVMDDFLVSVNVTVLFFFSCHVRTHVW